MDVELTNRDTSGVGGWARAREGLIRKRKGTRVKVRLWKEPTDWFGDFSFNERIVFLGYVVK